MNLDILYEEEASMIFRFKDSSEIYCVTTLNLQLLESYSIDDVDGLVDLLTMKKIPPALLSDSNLDTVIIQKGRNYRLNKLDELFQLAIKRRWENV